MSDLSDLAGGDRAPSIGVTGMLSNQIHGLRLEGSVVAAAVLRSVVRAGGEPLTLFAESALPAAERLRGLDALVVPGGYDVDPARYGQDRHPLTVTADFAVQDQFESDMLAAAISIGLPVLAICRGYQLLNVECGGTMIQDLEADSFHRNSIHDVTIEEDSALASVLKSTRLPVSSYHHQALDRIGDGLRVVGRADDGTVEAIEHETADLIAVQWHPEDNSETDAQQQSIFDWVVERARQYGKVAA